MNFHLHKASFSTDIDNRTSHLCRIHNSKMREQGAARKKKEKKNQKAKAHLQVKLLSEM